MAFTCPMPLTLISSGRDKCKSPRIPSPGPPSSRIRPASSSTLSCVLPVRRITARSCASLKYSGPDFTQRSYGRSSWGSSFIFVCFMIHPPFPLQVRSGRKTTDIVSLPQIKYRVYKKWKTLEMVNNFFAARTTGPQCLRPPFSAVTLKCQALRDTRSDRPGNTQRTAA